MTTILMDKTLQDTPYAAPVRHKYETPTSHKNEPIQCPRVINIGSGLSQLGDGLSLGTLLLMVVAVNYSHPSARTPFEKGGGRLLGGGH